jgi:hypothetical protein
VRRRAEGIIDGCGYRRIEEVAEAYQEAVDLDARGGTIKLPDGSEIVVEATTWHRLAGESGKPDLLRRALNVGSFVHQHPSLRAEILSAYNARFGTAAQEATS